MTGGYIPFAKTRAEREAAGDPRPSLAERYGTQQGYVCAVHSAAEREVARRLLLPADAVRLYQQASAAALLPLEAAAPESAAVAQRLCGS
ncbi:MAG: alpha/beta hydrolase domain-containing protein [Minicystis sp.]